MAETLTYATDGIQCRSELYRADAANAPGVLVFPEVYGLGDHARERAGRLAGLGYHALAVDLLGDARRIENLDDALAEVNPLFADRSRMRARGQAALDALTGAGADASRIAAIGFCFGGLMALELARSGADVKAVAGFHSALTNPTPADAKRILGSVLIMNGANDPMVDETQRAAFVSEMRTSVSDWQLHIYGGVVHSFTNQQLVGDKASEAARYDEKADRRSWAATTALLAETLS